VKQGRPDWRIALEQMKGAHVIHDEATGEPYAGLGVLATQGIWQRWSHYAYTAPW
jgi:hypothetical protein